MLCRWLAACLIVAGLVPDTVQAGRCYSARARVAASSGCWCRSPFANYQDVETRASVAMVAMASSIASGGHKTFFPTPPRQKIETNGVTLSRVGVSLFDNGHHFCTGLLTYNGGPNKQFTGANVRIRVRAYSGTPQHEGDLNNMRLVLEAEKRTWIRRDESTAISLVPSKAGKGCSIRRNTVLVPGRNEHQEIARAVESEYARITHVEIVLEYLNAH